MTDENTWERPAPELSLTQLNDLERDGVHIQCVNSTDFVIGRQTNFNGPVTIITCAEVLKQRNREDKEKDDDDDNKEELVIREKVLSQTAAMKVHKLATENTDEEDPPKVLRFEKYKKVIWMFGFVCVGLLLAISITLGVIPTTNTDLLPKCVPLPNGFCIFSEFDWGGRRNSGSLSPLQTPVSYVVISQTYEDFCYEVSVCLHFVRYLQINTTDETACNFLIGGEGNVYEDRGWIWESYLEGPPAMGKALQICLMGNYTNDEYPTYPQTQTAEVLVGVGVENGYVSKDYVLLPSNATSPGKYLGTIYTIIRKWEKFSEELENLISPLSYSDGKTKPE